MLHIVCSKSAVTSCKSVLSADDFVLFIGDGVYGAERLNCADTYVLSEDVHARGLHVDSAVQIIDYDGFVELVANTSSSVTWT